MGAGVSRGGKAPRGFIVGRLIDAFDKEIAAARGASTPAAVRVSAARLGGGLNEPAILTVSVPSVPATAARGCVPKQEPTGAEALSFSEGPAVRPPAVW